MALTGLLGGLLLAGSAWSGPASGADDPGLVVPWALPVSRLLAVGLGTVTVGFLASAAFLTPQGRKGTLSHVGHGDARLAVRFAAGWSVAALSTALFNHAMIVAMPLHEALDPDVFWTYFWSVDINVAFMVSALAGLVVATVVGLTSRTGPVAGMLAVALIGVISPGLAGHDHGLGDHGLALASGSVHAAATALWFGSLVAVGRHILRSDAGLPRMVQRMTTLTTWALVAMVLSGAGSAYARVEQPGDLLTSGYGWLVLVKIALLTVLTVLAVQARTAAAKPASQRSRRSVWRWLLAEAGVLAGAIGVGVAMANTPNTRVEVPLNSPAEELLGFPFPPEPAAVNVVFGWHPDPIFLFGTLAVALAYGWGVVTLIRRGQHWPVGRTVSMTLGLLVVLWSTNMGIAAYATVSVGWHMLQHMTLAMLAPVLLVLGAPATLALRALRPSRSGDRGPREWLLWGLHSPVSKVITHPAYVLAISTFGLYGLYFTGLFPAMMGSHLGHVLMQLHFLVSGFLFYWVVVGVDPMPRQVPYWAKLVLLLVYLSLHGFFAIALMMTSQPIGEEWFGLVRPPWITDPLADTYLGGGIAWGFGEVPTLIVIIAVSVQWARSEDRLARRKDRAADRDGDAELRAYNERLARMNRAAEHREQR